MHISSTDNPKIKGAIKLRERRCRDEESLFLIEGYRELDRAVQGKVEIEALFFAEELFLGSNERTLIQKIEKSGAKIYSCSERVFRKISYRDRPDGLLAIAKKMNMRLDQLSMKKTPLFVIGEAIEKPGNLGTILRTSDAVGADAVIICDRCTDIYNPNVVRASVGTLFTLPVIEDTSENVLTFLQKHQVQIVAADPNAKSLYTDANLRKSTAIVFGTEQLGLSEFWKKNATTTVQIPMKGVADSLNVAMACTVLLYETLRQRHGHSV
jgi:TrmH family RNA methyltransferase